MKALIQLTLAILLCSTVLCKKNLIAQDLDTLGYLYHDSFSDYDLKLADQFLHANLRIYAGKPDTRDSLFDICNWMWESRISQNLPYYFDNIYTTWWQFLFLNQNYKYLIQKQEEYLHAHQEMESIPKLKLIKHLSHSYNKIGLFNHSIRLISEYLGEALESGDENLIADYYDHLIHEYLYLYSISDKYKVEVRRLNEACLSFYKKSKSTYGRAIHLLLSSYYMPDDKTDSLYQASIKILNKEKGEPTFFQRKRELNEFYLDILLDKKRYADYIRLYRLSISDDYAKNIFYLNYGISKAYYHSGRKKEGEKYLQKAIELYSNTQDKDLQRSILSKLPYLCELYGNSEMAYYFAKEQVKFNQEQFILENFHENELARFDAEINYQSERTQRQRRISYLLSVIVLMGVIAIIIIYMLYRRIQRKNNTISSTLEELKVANTNLEMVSRDVEIFAYTAAHDIKNPLHSIQGFIDLLKLDLDTLLSSENRLLFEYIDGSINNLDKIIQSIISYAKVKGTDKVKEDVDVYKSLQQSIIMLNADIENKKAIIELKGNFPVLIGYPELLHQLFLNLISNAIKYSRKNTKPILEIVAHQSGEQFILSFKDNGIGIPEENLSSIFELFSRADNSTDYEGTGIGLSVVKKIVSLHNARIEVKNNLDYGLCFNITFSQVKYYPEQNMRINTIICPSAEKIIADPVQHLS